VILNNLAGLYYSQGKYAEAESLYKRSLHIRENTLGPEHINVAVVCENLGKLYSQIGKKDKAEKLKARARKIRSKTVLKPVVSPTNRQNNLPAKSTDIQNIYI
jgi:tetratricopeptide (TPR) repeat protein